MRYHTKNGIHTVRKKDLAVFLQDRLDQIPVMPELQLEFDFGEGFNFWWYEDDVLHPNDSNLEELLPADDYHESDFDDDIPF